MVLNKRSTEAEEKDLKRAIAKTIRHLLERYQLTQQELADRLGISNSRIVAYLRERELPRLQTVTRMREMAEATFDEVLRGDVGPKAEDRPRRRIGVARSVKGSTAPGPGIYSTRGVTLPKYRPKEGDLSTAHAQQLKELVEKIIETEEMVKRRPRSYGAVWNGLNRRMGVTYYREIPDTEFVRAQAYLEQWLGRVERLRRETDPKTFGREFLRRDTYKRIFARAKQLGLSKDEVDDLVLARFGKGSIQDLSQQELDQLYNSIMGFKKKPTKSAPPA